MKNKTLPEKQNKILENRNSLRYRINRKSSDNLNEKDSNTIERIRTNTKFINLNSFEVKHYFSDKPSRFEEIKVKRVDECGKLANHNYTKYQEEFNKLIIKEEIKIKHKGKI